MHYILVVEVVSLFAIRMAKNWSFLHSECNEVYIAQNQIAWREYFVSF